MKKFAAKEESSHPKTLQKCERNINIIQLSLLYPPKEEKKIILTQNKRTIRENKGGKTYKTRMLK